jgi:glycosyltransferase involved in cell wall biosynthesis
MNICMLTRMMPTHGHGGVQDHTAMLASGLARRGHAVTVITTALEDGREREALGGVSIEYVSGMAPGKLTGSWGDESCRAVERLHRAAPFDLIHSQGPAGYALVRSNLHRRLKVPVLIAYHGTHYDELVTRWRRGFSISPWRTAKNMVAIAIVLRKMAGDFRAIAHTDGVIATSNEQAVLLERVYRVRRERIHTVFNGVELEGFTPGVPPEGMRERLRIDPGATVLLSVARLIRDKGVQHAIAALPEVRRAFPACTLIVVGDGAYRPALERLARRVGAEEAVRFVGGIPFGELPDYFRLCDLFINSTVQQNGYDLTMVEAMACGKAVVSSNIGSTPTLISDGVDGLLFPTADRGALARRVIGILGDEGGRAAIGARARQKVLSQFTLEAMVEATLGAYRTVLART